MEWAKREFSKGQINQAGQILLAPENPYVLENALEIINNWRAAHYYPLNTFKVTLRRKSQEIDPESLVAQRIKRMSSIHHKLDRFPNMRLSQMQDIGGCRAIVTNIEHVRALVKKYESSDLKHRLCAKDDYIISPKCSGYRGVHLIYKCFYDKPVSSVYNNQHIEMQIRSKPQHAWATAVETVGTFLNQALKSSQGEEDWLRFFELMGSVIAIKEKTALVPDTPTTKAALVAELRMYAEDLNVEHTLNMFGTALNIGANDAQLKGHYYFLLKLEPSKNTMGVFGFKKNEVDLATDKYLQVEKEISGVVGSQAVLVSADSFNALRRAYPNYFLDTIMFINELKRALGR